MQQIVVYLLSGKCQTETQTRETGNLAAAFERYEWCCATGRQVCSFVRDCEKKEEGFLSLAEGSNTSGAYFSCLEGSRLNKQQPLCKQQVLFFFFCIEIMTKGRESLTIFYSALKKSCRWIMQQGLNTTREEDSVRFFLFTTMTVTKKKFTIFKKDVQ